MKRAVYRKAEKSINSCDNFELEGRLSDDNRWVVMAKLIPWSEFESEYASLFSEEMGAPAKNFRMALGSLIIKEKLGTSDIETVEQIRENPYLQYFIAYPTDLNLLNQARVVTEKIIDKLYKPLRTSLKNKPKTYRKKARKNYLKIAKQRKPRKKARRSRWLCIFRLFKLG